MCPHMRRHDSTCVQVREWAVLEALTTELTKPLFISIFAPKSIPLRGIFLPKTADIVWHVLTWFEEKKSRLRVLLLREYICPGYKPRRASLLRKRMSKGLFYIPEQNSERRCLRTSLEMVLGSLHRYLAMSLKVRLLSKDFSMNKRSFKERCFWFPGIKLLIIAHFTAVRRAEEQFNTGL